MSVYSSTTSSNLATYSNTAGDNYISWDDATQEPNLDDEAAIGQQNQDRLPQARLEENVCLMTL